MHARAASLPIEPRASFLKKDLSNNVFYAAVALILVSDHGYNKQAKCVHCIRIESQTSISMNIILKIVIEA